MRLAPFSCRFELRPRLLNELSYKAQECMDRRYLHRLPVVRSATQNEQLQEPPEHQ
jgi:hypothetical protein